MTTMKRPKLVENYRPWTELEDALMRAEYVTRGARALSVRLDRSWYAVTNRARLLRLVIRKPWTREDDALLRCTWGDESLGWVARALGRTSMATYDRARLLGLPVGCPPGGEFLSDAAARVGFHVKSLRRILKWARISVRPTLSCPRAHKTRWHKHYVDPIEVDDAVERWCASETPGQAAVRLGVSPATVRRALQISALPIPGRPRRKAQWQIPSELIDRAMAARQEHAAR